MGRCLTGGGNGSSSLAHLCAHLPCTSSFEAALKVQIVHICTHLHTCALTSSFEAALCAHCVHLHTCAHLPFEAAISALSANCTHVCTFTHFLPCTLVHPPPLRGCTKSANCTHLHTCPLVHHLPHLAQTTHLHPPLPPPVTLQYYARCNKCNVYTTLPSPF